VDPLIGPIEGAEHHSRAGVEIDLVRAGHARMKRVVYPPGFRWSKDMKPEIGGDRCMHAHVGFLARGAIAGEYADGCAFAYEAPAFVALDPGHDAWVASDEPAILVEFDFEGETTEKLGLPPEHTHS
jgi:hypothetical protein